MSAGDCLRVDSAEALARATSVRVLARVFLPRIEVTASRLSPDEARAAQDRIDRLVDACGCGEGAAATLVSLAAWVAWLAGPGAWPGFGAAAWRLILVLFAGATVGKVFGLARARVALRRELRLLVAPDGHGVLGGRTSIDEDAPAPSRPMAPVMPERASVASVR